MDAYDIMLYASYALTIIGTLLSIALPLFKSLDNPKGLLKSALGVAGIGVLFFISFAISGNEVLPQFSGDPFNMTPFMSQAIGGMLIMTYALSIIALGAILVSELVKAVK